MSIFRSQYPVFKVRRARGSQPVSARELTIRIGVPRGGANRPLHTSSTSRGRTTVTPSLTCGSLGTRTVRDCPPIRRRAPAALATGALRDRKMPLVGQRRPALPRTDSAVPSALGGLTSGFGMGPGVPPPPWSLTNKGHSLPGRPSPCPGGRTARRNRVPPARPHPTPHARKSMRRRARPISTARLNACWRLHLRPISS